MVHPDPAACNKRYVRATMRQFADEGEAKAGSAARNSYSNIGEWITRGENGIDSFVIGRHESSSCRGGRSGHISGYKLKVTLSQARFLAFLLMAGLLTISEGSRRSGGASSALRFYEVRGLIQADRA